MKLHGIIPPIVTPLDERERVHEEQLRRVTEHLLTCGVHGIFVNGSMGMFDLLRDEEQHQAIGIVVDQVAGRVPVIAGASETSTSRVIDKAQRIVDSGADYLSILPPYYGAFTSAQLVRFYQTVARNVGLPVLAYNNPWKLLSRMDVPVLLQLADEPNVVGVKDSCEDAIHYQSLVRGLSGRDGFSVLLGTTRLSTWGLFLGADGLIDGLHIMKAEWAVELWNAAQRGHWPGVQDYQRRLEMLISLVECEEWLGAFELVLRELGLCDKITAHPLVPLSDRDLIRRVQGLVQDLLLTDGGPAGEQSLFSGVGDS